MEHTQKVRVLPEDKYQMLIRNSQENTTPREDEEAQGHGTSSETLELQSQEVMSKVGGNNERKLAVEVIVSALPKKFRNKAMSFLTHLLNHPQPLINWDERGEVSIKGEIIPNSHISDLVKYTVSPFKSFIPNGFYKFNEVANEMGLPKSLFGKKEDPRNLKKQPPKSLPPPPGIPTNKRGGGKKKKILSRNWMNFF